MNTNESEFSAALNSFQGNGDLPVPSLTSKQVFEYLGVLPIVLNTCKTFL